MSGELSPVAAESVGDLGFEGFRRSLRGTGLGVRIGPFEVRIRARVTGLEEPLYELYQHHPRLDVDERVFSCHIDMHEVWRPLSPSKKFVRFVVDGRLPHEDMPREQALAVLEWGLNLVIALRFHCFLMLHAAALERNGKAILLPAAPGDGKTTLCVALAHRGWRLLSDEFGLVRPGGTDVIPIPRPMPLKNESIAVIRSFAPDAAFGPTIPNTRKGTVAHVRPPLDSIVRMDEAAPVRWLVFPRWVAASPTVLEEVGKAESFMRLATNAFNYEALGAAAFRTASDIVDNSQSLYLQYSDLDEAVDLLTRLADDLDG